MARAAGWEDGGEGMLGKIMGEVRRSASVAVVRSQALCYDLFVLESSAGQGTTKS